MVSLKQRSLTGLHRNSPSVICMVHAEQMQDAMHHQKRQFIVD
jgi:hypothetical protein